MAKGSLFADRVYIREKALRQRLQNLFPGGKHFLKARGIQAVTPMGSELQRLLDDLEIDHRPALAAVLKIIFHNKPTGEACRHRYLPIVWTLALDSPVCATLKPQLFGTIEVSPT